MAAKQIDPISLRAKQAAEVVGVSGRTWAALQSAGKLPPSFKLGGCRLWRVSDLRLWAESNFPPLDRFVEIKAERGRQ